MLEHVAIWTRNLEGMKDFYCSYFDGKAGAKYQSKSEFHAVSYTHLDVYKRQGCPRTTNCSIHRKGASSFCLEKYLRF